MLEQPVLEGLHPVGRTHVGTIREEMGPVGRSHVEEVCGELSHERDLTLKQGKSVRSPPPEEEGAAETTCDELTITPIPCPPAPLGGRRERKSGMKLSLGRGESLSSYFLSPVQLS